MQYPTDLDIAFSGLPEAVRSARGKSLLNGGARRLRQVLRPLLGAGLAVAFFCFGAVPAQASPTLQLSNGSLASSQLMIGDDLWVGLKDAAPGATYDFRLLSAGGALITGAYGTADAAGAVAPFFLWGRTGVVGCDCGAGADPELFRFETFEQAETALSGKSLYLQVLTLSGVQVARTAIPALATRREISYFSDGAGCPRGTFKAGEAVHMSFLHPDRSQPSRKIFVAASKPWPVGEPIRDLRGAVQSVSLPALGDRVTLPLGISIPTPGSYDGIVRKEQVLDSIRFGPDFVLANPQGSTIYCYEGSGGIIITQDGCPNCGGPSYP